MRKLLSYLKFWLLWRDVCTKTPKPNAALPTGCSSHTPSRPYMTKPYGAEPYSTPANHEPWPTCEDTQPNRCSEPGLIACVWKQALFLPVLRIILLSSCFSLRTEPAHLLLSSAAPGPVPAAATQPCWRKAAHCGPRPPAARARRQGSRQRAPAQPGLLGERPPLKYKAGRTSPQPCTDGTSERPTFRPAELPPWFLSCERSAMIVYEPS